MIFYLFEELRWQIIQDVLGSIRFFSSEQERVGSKTITIDQKMHLSILWRNYSLWNSLLFLEWNSAIPKDRNPNQRRFFSRTKTFPPTSLLIPMTKAIQFLSLKNKTIAVTLKHMSFPAVPLQLNPSTIFLSSKILVSTCEEFFWVGSWRCIRNISWWVKPFSWLLKSWTLSSNVKIFPEISFN